VHRSEAKLRSIFESAAVGIARVSVDGGFLEVNDRFVEIAGWPREDLLGGTFQQITHADDLQADLDLLGALLRGETGWFAMEKRYIRKDGGVVWAHLTASIIRNAAGEPDHLVSIIRDISEEKRIQQSRDLLMREVDHRARNALTVVQSVVRLTRSDDPQAFKRSVIGRVDALARAQSSLSRANWTGSALRDIVVEELSSSADPGQWRAHGPEVLLQAETVQPLGMILHELSTNSVKYGALSAAGGEVAIAWDRREDGGWRLVWTESGGPPVAHPERSGFGSRLINRLATELGGAVAFHWRPDGLVVELDVDGRTIALPRAKEGSEPQGA
jgi:PAS domain S-box-containing protein